jgi:hypothetical protein
MRTTKPTLVGGIAAIALVAGGAGMAIAHAQGTVAPAVASDGTSPTATATATPTKAAKGDKVGRDAAKQILGRLKDFQHAEWVTKGDANTYVTHEAILGQVEAVSSTSITVKSSDGTSMTFAVNDQTTVHRRHAKGATTSTTPSITDVKQGQTVLVGGEKTPDPVAKKIVARS